MAATDTAVVRLAPDAVAALAAAVAGPVLRPEDEGYEQECAGTYNLNFPLTPALVVGATSPADVQAAVRFAVAQNRPLSVLAGGHASVRPDPEAVLITTRRMAAVTVRADERIARIEAGARWRDVIAAAAPLGLAPPNGSYPGVGAVSYVLTGGMSPVLGRTVGWAADRVRSMDIVTADGELRTIGPDAEPDLFWAVRGTRGNFGVVTALEIDLFPVARLYGGSFKFPGPRIPEVLRTWARWLTTVPEEMSTSIAVLRFPDLPFVPPPLRGKMVTAVRIAYLGDAAEGERLVAPLRALGPVADTVAEMPYSEVGSIHADPDDPSPAIDASHQLTALPPEAVEALLAVAGPDVEGPLTVIEIRLLGGALSRPAEVPNALEIRDGQFQLTLLKTAGPEATAEFEAGVAQLLDALAPWSVGHASVGYLAARDAGRPEVVRTAYRPESWDRLTALKARWDPANTFRVNANIPPDRLGDPSDPR